MMGPRLALGEGGQTPFCAIMSPPPFHQVCPHTSLCTRGADDILGVNSTRQIRALPTETKVESGTSYSKSGTFVNVSNSGLLVKGPSLPKSAPSPQ